MMMSNEIMRLNDLWTDIYYRLRNQHHEKSLTKVYGFCKSFKREGSRNKRHCRSDSSIT